MKLIRENQLEVYQFENLSNEPGICHAVTTRQGGVSKEHAGSWNLGFGVEDNPDDVTENRKRLAAFVKVPFEKLVFQKQTHSTHYKIITTSNYTEPVLDNDAMITNEKGIAIAVLGADCVPVLLYDRKQQVIAAIHAGWKGTAGGVTRKVVQAMKTNFHSQPENILAGIGPSICAANYEVGPEVIDAFTTHFKNADRLISMRHGEKAHVDLWKANEAWLMEEGIPKQNIEISGLCTFENPDTFYSARYFKNQTGRFASVIVLK